MIIILNNTGHIGSNFCSYLNDLKINFVCLSKDYIKNCLLEKKNLFNRHTFSSNEEIFIFNFFGEFKNKKIFYDYNYTFINNLIDEIESIILTNSLKINLIHISSASSKYHNIINSKVDYGFTKLKADEFIIEQSKRIKNFNYLIIRPGMIISYKTKNKFIYLLNYIVKIKFFLLVNPSPQFLLTDIDDLNSLLIKSLDINLNKVLNLFYCINLNDLIILLETNMNIKINLIKIPNLFLKAFKPIINLNKNIKNLFLQYNDIKVDKLNNKMIDKIKSSIINFI